MNFYNKKFRKLAATLILVIIAAMLVTMVLPYIM